MEKKCFFCILAFVLIIAIGIIAYFGWFNQHEDKYRCKIDSDCFSTCGEGCVNEKFFKSYEDTCVNVRAWECECIDKICHTDGNPPSLSNELNSIQGK